MNDDEMKAAAAQIVDAQMPVVRELIARAREEGRAEALRGCREAAARALIYLDGDDAVMENVKEARRILRELVASGLSHSADTGGKVDVEAVRARARAEALWDAIGRGLAWLRNAAASDEWDASDESFLVAILADEPKEGGKPEAGDLVISASSETVQWNGLPDPWYWTTEDEVAMQDETIVVLMRRAEVVRRIKEATE